MLSATASPRAPTSLAAPPIHPPPQAGGPSRQQVDRTGCLDRRRSPKPSGSRLRSRLEDALMRHGAYLLALTTLPGPLPQFIRGGSSRRDGPVNSYNTVTQVLRGEWWGFKSVLELSTCSEQDKHRVEVSEDRHRARLHASSNRQPRSNAGSSPHEQPNRSIIVAARRLRGRRYRSCPPRADGLRRRHHRLGN
jgi:hypothetical protein